VSKFRHVRFDLDDEERKAIYVDLVAASGRSRGDNVAAFFRATFAAWKNWRASGAEEVYVGYSPVVTVDTARILADLPGAHVLHVVRNPWSAYADTKKRPVPMPLDAYLRAWRTCQHEALLARRRWPDRVHVVRAEDVMADGVAALGPVCEALGLRAHDALAAPSWNADPLDEVFPWGTIRAATPAANRATAAELDAAEVEQVRALAWPFLDELGYADFPG
ncbi:MAG: sulfotransferase, partial [Microthrixaceae bacterium]|nr:sulfotransferase [Microthrixaceae bacterium]